MVARVRGLAGNDVLTGGAGGNDQVAYDRDSRHTSNTTGVTVNLALGFAIDLFGDEDTLAGFETVIGSEFGDTITAAETGTRIIASAGDDMVIGNIGNDYFELGAGADDVVFNAGVDLILDFNPGEDSVAFDGIAAEFFDTVVVEGFDDGTNQGAQLRFSDEDDGVHILQLNGVTIEEAESLVDFPAFSGTDGDDTIEIATENGDSVRLTASGGNDTYIFTNSAETAYQELFYVDLGVPSITATLNANVTNSTVDKGDAGTDTLRDVGQVAGWGFGIVGTTGNDTFNLTHNTSGGFAWFGVFESGGDDTINLLGGNGTVRVQLGSENEDVTANLASGSVTSSAGAVTINRVGADTFEVDIEIQTRGGNDTVTGSPFDDRVILGLGTDTANAGEGNDRIRYDRDEYTLGVNVNLATGTATDAANSGQFSHTLSNFEEVIGSSFDDRLTANDAGTRLEGRNGDDTLIGGAGRDRLIGGDGDDILDASAGSIDNQSIGDFVDPGTGTNTIIGHQQLWEQGDGIDLHYAGVSGTGGITISVGGNGSGTVTSANPGVVDDTFTYAHYFIGTSDADTFNGSGQDFEGWQGRAGNDTINGGDGWDRIDYIDDHFSGGFGGVSVNLLSGTATDGFGDTDTFTGIEEARGTDQNDTFIGSNNNERFQGRGGNDTFSGAGGDDRYDLGAGADTVVFSDGKDYISDFNILEDSIQFGSKPIDQIGTLRLFPFSTNFGHSFAFDNEFDGNFDTDFELSMGGVSLEQMYQILASMTFTPANVTGTDGEDLGYGTPANDTINLGGNDSGVDRIFASAGDDRLIFSDNNENGYQEVRYNTLGAVGLTANINLNDAENTVNKGVAGTDTLVDVNTAASGDGFGILDGPGDDIYTISLHETDRGWFGISDGGGADVFDLTGGNGTFRYGTGYDGEDIFADLRDGVIDISGARTATLNYFGDFTDTRIELRTGNGDDTVFGSDLDNRFILGSGTDSVDGRDGFDFVRYNRNGVDNGVDVNLQTGTATGVWDTQTFSHSLTSIEGVQGSDFDDVLTAADAGGSDVQGRGGDDLIRRAGFDEGWTDGGPGRDTLLQTSSGSFDFAAINVGENYRGVEILSFENGGADTATLSLQNVFDFQQSFDELAEGFFGTVADAAMIVHGDAGDSLRLGDGEFEQVRTATDGAGRTLDIYQHETGGNILALVAVDQDVTVDAGISGGG